MNTETETLLEQAEKLQSYWQIHSNDPTVVAKWAMGDMLPFLERVIGELS